MNRNIIKFNYILEEYSEHDNILESINIDPEKFEWGTKFKSEIIIKNSEIIQHIFINKSVFKRYLSIKKCKLEINQKQKHKFKANHTNTRIPKLKSWKSM